MDPEALTGPPGPIAPPTPSDTPQEALGALGAAPEDALPGAMSAPPVTLGRARAPRNRQRSGAWPAGGVPRVSPDSLELVADDVAYWIETTAREVARSMMDGVYAPFSARVSPQEQARYYAETLFTPQGSLDPVVWGKEFARLGPEGLSRAINGAAAYRRSRGLPVLLPQSRFQPTASDYLGVTPAAGITAPSEGGEPPTDLEDEPPTGGAPSPAY